MVLAAYFSAHATMVNGTPGSGATPARWPDGVSHRINDEGSADVCRATIQERGRGVIRQMHLTSQKNISTPSTQKVIEIRKNGVVKVKTVSPRVPVRHGIERASARVSFLDIGKPGNRGASSRRGERRRRRLD